MWDGRSSLEHIPNTTTAPSTTSTTALLRGSNINRGVPPGLSVLLDSPLPFAHLTPLPPPLAPLLVIMPVLLLSVLSPLPLLHPMTPLTPFFLGLIQAQVLFRPSIWDDC